ncbi:Tryptophan halogenase [Rheinheimera sp. A13L]|uniref:tryptophan halogenase family protein n=1 Tax=Rheinheimera sp. A13L TaxID=506534 RepID=UPI0002125374|nr:tryptophan halogenase family protein [Rheinheimera sp. A13L]EGM76796.1 Tryptophan halogenase [Rheinheimera sp. A13L]
MINRIIIVGGGTAGWLVANHLGQAMKSRPEMKITLIESPTIPTIGVGEGTVPAIRQSLRKFGISESDFIQRCNVTFKQSIKFVNWLDKNIHGENHYHHLFDVPVPYGIDLAPFWLNQHKQTAFADLVAAQYQVVEAGLAPKAITSPEFGGLTSYAYHLDARKFADFLHEHAVKHFGINHLYGDITDIDRDVDGYITALHSPQLGLQPCDFVIDCSGFNSVLLGEKMQVKFIDRSDHLLTDVALAVQIPTMEHSIVPPYTLATAHQAGWIWDIALTNRRGVGLVYSSSHMDEEQACLKLNRYIGGGLENYPWRKINMRIGRREKFWHKNCVAIGLSQGFVEPLEATSILMTDFSADLLSKRFPENRAALELLEQRFNQRLLHAWEQTFDFIKLHYCISDRSDSSFWLDNRDPATIPDTLLQKIALWRHHPPAREDFFTKFEIFDFENYLYVLYGMKFNTPAPKLAPEYIKMAAAVQERVTLEAEVLKQKLISHRALLEKIHKFGLQRL